MVSRNVHGLAETGREWEQEGGQRQLRSRDCVLTCNVPVRSVEGTYASLGWLLDGEAYKSESGGASACGC